MAGLLGAGLARMDERIDPDAGLSFHKKIGDTVTAGDSICSLLASDESLFPEDVCIDFLCRMIYPISRVNHTYFM